MATSGGKILVAAIDFGTTYSGYGFAYCSDPDSILMSKNWGAELGHQSYKTATSLLVDKNGAFIAFGFEAEQQYGNSVNDNDNDDNEVVEGDSEDVACEDLHLFKHFKMELHNMKKFDKNKKIKATDGYEMPAIEVFGQSLKFLKDHLLEAVNTANKHQLEANDVCWVLTVPAIWNEMAKTFMKEAAFNGELTDSPTAENLIIALEPESASLFCRTKDISYFVQDDSVTKETLNEGDTYMIIDAGGGTMDITVHKIKNEDRVTEIQKPSGGPWGGIYVDKKLNEFSTELLGDEFLSSYKNDYPNQWLSIMLNWENQKKAINHSKGKGQKTLNLNLSMTFVEKYTKVTGFPIAKTIKEKESMGVVFKAGFLRIKTEIVVKFFDAVINPTVDHVRKLLQQKNVVDIKCIFLVGGFGESKYLQHRIKEEFQTANRPVLIPNDASICVIKGAVLFGYAPKTIASRIARQTICFKTTVDFDPAKHPRKWILNTHASQKVHVLLPMVTMNQDVEDGFITTKTTRPVAKGAKSVKFDIYSSEKEEVCDPNDPDVELMGSVVIPVDDKLSKDENRVSFIMTFGGTSFSVTARHEKTGIEEAVELQFPE